MTVFVYIAFIFQRKHQKLFHCKAQKILVRVLDIIFLCVFSYDLLVLFYSYSLWKWHPCGLDITTMFYKFISYTYYYLKRMKQFQTIWLVCVTDCIIFSTKRSTHKKEGKLKTIFHITFHSLKLFICFPTSCLIFEKTIVMIVVYRVGFIGGLNRLTFLCYEFEGRSEFHWFTYANIRNGGFFSQKM